MSKKIKIIRKRIGNRKWLLKRRDHLLQESKDWHTFEKFDCSTFFKGYELAAHNRVLYKKGSARVTRQLAFINELLKSTQ